MHCPARGSSPSEHAPQRVRFAVGAKRSGHGKQNAAPVALDVVPRGHGGQLLLPGRLWVPGGHGTHARSSALPLPGACVPAGHGTQDVAPVVLTKVPGGHRVHVVEASPLYSPIAHRMHVPLTAVPFNHAPAGHGSQRMAPGVGARCPAAHGWHSALPSPADLPAGHTSHPPMASCPGCRCVPAGHGVHSVAADELAKRPGAHGSQSGDPGEDVCVPGEQAVQLSHVERSTTSV